MPQTPQQPPMPQQPPAPAWGQPQQSNTPGYTQPLPDPTAAYGQQSFPGQQSYPGQQSFPGGYQQPQGYGSEYPQYPPAGPKRGNGGLIAIIVGAVLVVGGGVTAAIMLTGKHNGTPVASGTPTVPPSTSASPNASDTPSISGSNPLTTPSGVSGLTLLDNTAAKDQVANMQTSLDKDKELYPDPVIAAYNDSTGDNVTELFEAQAINQLSSKLQGEFNGTAPADFVSGLMTGAGIDDAQDQTTAAVDGALSCGTKTIQSQDVMFCFWDDNQTFGGLEFYDSPSATDAASATDAMRAAAEGD